MLCNREEPSWEPSPGLEKSTLQLLGCSTGQGGHPFPQQLPGKKKKEKKSQFLCVCGGESVIFYCNFFLFPFLFFLFFLFLFFFWGCFISALFLCLGQNPGELMGCCLCCSAWGCSLSVPWEGWMEGWKEGGVPWPSPLQQHLQSWVGI